MLKPPEGTLHKYAKAVLAIILVVGLAAVAMKNGWDRGYVAGERKYQQRDVEVVTLKLTEPTDERIHRVRAYAFCIASTYVLAQNPEAYQVYSNLVSVLEPGFLEVKNDPVALAKWMDHMDNELFECQTGLR